MNAFRKTTYAALPAFLLACGADEPTTTRAEVRAPATAVLVPEEAVLDSIGEFLHLTLTVFDQNGEEFDYNPGSVAWTSLDPAVATVSAMGVVQTRGPGTTTIVAAVDDKGSTTKDIEADATVTVVEKDQSP